LTREALESIVSNLLENAKTHGGGGGSAVKVELRLAAFGPKTCRITVADDGPGISPANRARGFDAFFTTARAKGGTGLGLAIVRALAEAARGRIELDPEEGRGGASFSVYLPAL
jgi:signal transduction histidine kinase